MKHDTPWKAIMAVLERNGFDRPTRLCLATEIHAALIAGLDKSDSNIIFALKEELTWGKIHEKENTP